MREPKDLVICRGCERPVLRLADELRDVCWDCDRRARSVVRRKFLNREYQRRFRARRAARKHSALEVLTMSIEVTRPAQHGPGALIAPYLRDRVEPPERPAPVLPASPELRDSYCACGRSLNLGRYKTEGDTCGTCKREQRRASRPQGPAYASIQAAAADLESTLSQEEFDRLLDDEDDDAA